MGNKSTEQAKTVAYLDRLAQRGIITVPTAVGGFKQIGECPFNTPTNAAALEWFEDGNLGLTLNRGAVLDEQ